MITKRSRTPFFVQVLKAIAAATILAGLARAVELNEGEVYFGVIVLSLIYITAVWSMLDRYR